MKLISILSVILASVSGATLRHRDHSIVNALEFKHRLRVCNAYPSSAWMDVYRGRVEKLTDEPMQYKSCRDFKVQLKRGDKIEFKVGDVNAGTFSIVDLPNNDAVLLLVIYRHDTLSTSVSFESHVFANLLNAQIAVIDTYKGSKSSRLSIQDHNSSKSSRSEELRYNSVVAVNPGKYEVVLSNNQGKNEAHGGLVALNRESYVILRVGVDSQQGEKYDEDLVLYPLSNSMLLNDATSLSLTTASLIMIVSALFW